jgi:hypothetical protein
MRPNAQAARRQSCRAASGRKPKPPEGGRQLPGVRTHPKAAHRRTAVAGPWTAVRLDARQSRPEADGHPEADGGCPMHAKAARRWMARQSRPDASPLPPARRHRERALGVGIGRDMHLQRGGASAGIGKGLALGKGPGGRRWRGCASGGIGKGPRRRGRASAGIGKGPMGGQQWGRASAGIGKGPQGRAAALTHVRGNRERAPGAGGSIDAHPRASGKCPGAGRGGTRICGHRERAHCVGSVGIRKGPQGRVAALRVHGHRKRAPGAGSTAGMQASGKGPGAGGVMDVRGHPERAPGGGGGRGGGNARPQASGTGPGGRGGGNTASGKGPAGGGGGRVAAGIGGKGPGVGRHREKGPRGRTAAWTQVRRNRERAPGAGGSIDERAPGLGRGGTRICGHRERARCVGCASAGIGKGPQGRVAALMRVRGHQERAPGGGQRRGRRHQERAPGREASGTSAGIGKGPGWGQQRGWVAAGTRVHGRCEPVSAGMGKGPRVMHPKAARRWTAASTHVKAARRLTVVAGRTPKPPGGGRGCRTASGRTGHTPKPPGRMPKPPGGAAARRQTSGKGPGVGIGGDTHPPRGRGFCFS